MDSADDIARLYGTANKPFLDALQVAMAPEYAAIIDRFFQRIVDLPGAGRVIATMSEEQRNRLKTDQLNTLKLLTSASLDFEQHVALAMRVGRIHCFVGLTRRDLAFAHEILLTLVRERVDVKTHAFGLSVLGQRLMRDVALQMDAFQQIEVERQQLIEDVGQIVWSAGSYPELIERLATRIGKYEEIALISFGRLDKDGVFRFENVKGKAARAFLQKAEQAAGGSIHEYSEGPIGRAWRNGTVEHCINFVTDPGMAPFREMVLAEGLRSAAAVPLQSSSRLQSVILSLSSAYLGGFYGVNHELFLRQLQSQLEFGLSRIEHREGRSSAMSYTTRQRWRSRLRSGGLEMHYQPLLCLRTGEVVKVEALARLRDAGKLMFPGDFFPVLLPEDFIEMYARGLEQALTHRADWLARGHDIGLSFNLPSSALVDSRYYDITEHVLEKHGCPAHVLTLELLETDEVPTSVDVLGELQRFRNLGVGLAEDDLGSGYSSLERLREMPFDIVKIDRSIVRRADQDMSNTLRFIYQLTRLGHSLGKNVVVEGIEDEGLLEAIAMLGADIVQGYVVSRPMDSPSLMEWLETYEPPAAPDRHAPRSFAAKLARLLVWEEHLHLLLEEQEAVQVEINRDLPFERVDVTVQRNLINAAKRYRIGSREYQRVRQQLVEVLAAER